MDTSEHLYIDGDWVPSSDGTRREVEDPSTGEAFAEVAEAGSADVDRAVAAARRAFDAGPWPRLDPAQRRALLLRLAAELARRSATLVDTVTREAGCPIRMTDFLQVGTPIGHIQDYADHALLLGSTGTPILHEPAFGHSERRRVPIGVCVGFIPFNFPLFMAIWKLAPAVAMGNTVVLKPSPLTPLAATELVRAVDHVGFPPGVVNLVQGDAEVGEQLVRHRDVDRVSFTGSTAVGRRVMELCAGTVKRLTLELGGKSPSIVLDDTDLELAVKGTLFGAMLHAGQACVATTRMLVPRSRADEAFDLLRDLGGQIKVGPAGDFASDIGPVITRAARDRVARSVDKAAQAGAKVLVGGSVADTGLGGHYYEPTILVDVDPASSVARQELFGPVLAVSTYDTDRDAVRLANDTDYGLAASVWGTDLDRARLVARDVRAGTVWVNDFGVLPAGTPFGGMKQSGFGRELSPESSLGYTEQQHLYTALDRDLDRRPYTLVGLGWP